MTASLPTLAIAPSAMSRSQSAVVLSIGAPVRNMYAVMPVAWPVPIGSQTLGSGQSSSTSSTKKGQLIAWRSSSYRTM